MSRRAIAVTVAACIVLVVAVTAVVSAQRRPFEESLGELIDIFDGGGDGGGDFGVEPPRDRPGIDPSGAAPSAEFPPPDFSEAVAGDDDRPRLPLGDVDDVPNEHRLDFLFEGCEGVGSCFRDAHFLDPEDPSLGSGPFPSGVAFFVAHGFPNDGEPLDESFDVVVYVSREFGQLTRYTSDYVLRGEDADCGPRYRDVEEPIVCEWFVHDFPDGLPEGRHQLWAVWEAPCRAWIEYGFVDGCDDPDEVLSPFWSGVDSPFGEPGAPGYHERDGRDDRPAPVPFEAEASPAS